ncbi:MAG TPA: hypothetical protein DCG78_07635 [Anaerolineaceae bacterium]|nr:hypothetical protein [Anaerolineaceae bacterium]
MANEEKTKKRRGGRRPVLTIVLVLVVAAGVYFLIQYQQYQQGLQTVAQLETVPYRRETFISSVNGTGTVRPEHQAVLIWQTSGTVEQSELTVGDAVHNDQVILKLDENDLPIDIIQARADKISIEIALEDLESNTALQRTQLQANIAQAQTSLSSLLHELEILEERECTVWRLNNLRTNYEDAVETYQNNPTEQNLAKVRSTKAELDFCDPEVIDQQIEELNAQIAVQNQNIKDTQAKLEKIENGPDPDEKERLELQLEAINKRLASIELKAPFDGTLTALYTKPGDVVSAGMQAAQLADLSQLYVDVPISEVDIPHIQLEQVAELVFDAFFEQTFTGKVVEIDHVGDARTGVVSYRVTIALDNGQDQIKPGMTAGVTILTEERQNVFTVPSQALTTYQGKDVVYVLRDNLPVPVEVNVGSYSNEKFEITQADIEEGELIILNPPSGLLSMIQNPFGR